MNYNDSISKLSYNEFEKINNIASVLNDVFNNNYNFKNITREEFLTAIDYHLYNSYLNDKYKQESLIFYDFFAKTNKELYMVSKIYNEHASKYNVREIVNEKDNFELERKLVVSLSLYNTLEDFLNFYKYLNLDLQNKISNMKKVINLIDNETLYNESKNYFDSYIDLITQKGSEFTAYLIENDVNDDYKMKIMKIDIKNEHKIELFNSLSNHNKMKLLIDFNSFIYSDYYKNFENSDITKFNLNIPKSELIEYFNSPTCKYEAHLLGFIEIFMRKDDNLLELKDVINRSVNHYVCEETFHIKRINDLYKDDLKSFKKQKSFNLYDYAFTLSFSKISDDIKLGFLNERKNFKTLVNEYKEIYEKKINDGEVDFQIINALPSAKKIGIDLSYIQNNIEQIISYIFKNKHESLNRFSLNLLLEMYLQKEAEKAHVLVTPQVLHPSHYMFFSNDFEGDAYKGLYSDCANYTRPIIAINDNYISEDINKSIDAFLTLFHELGHAIKNQISLKENLSYVDLKIAKEKNFNKKNSKNVNNEFNYDRSYIEYDANIYGYNKMLDFLKAYNIEKDFSKKKSEIIKEKNAIDESMLGFVIYDEHLYDIDFLFKITNSREDIKRLVPSYKSLLLEYGVDGHEIKASRILRCLDYQSNQKIFSEDKYNLTKKVFENKIKLKDPKVNGIDVKFDITSKLENILEVLENSEDFIRNKYQKTILNALIEISRLDAKYNILKKLENDQKSTCNEVIKKLDETINKVYGINDVYDNDANALCFNIKKLSM